MNVRDKKLSDVLPILNNTYKSIDIRAMFGLRGGHKISYQQEYPNHKVYPVLFTNKEKFSQTAVDKARNNVRLLRAVELVAFLNKYLELMEEGWIARLLPEKIAVMQKTPNPDDLEVLFQPSDEPQITVEDFEEIIKW